MSSQIWSSSTQKTKLHLVVVNPRKGHITNPVAWSQLMWGHVPPEKGLLWKPEIPQQDDKGMRWCMPLFSWTLLSNGVSAKAFQCHLQSTTLLKKKANISNNWDWGFPMRRESKNYSCNCNVTPLLLLENRGKNNALLLVPFSTPLFPLHLGCYSRQLWSISIAFGFKVFVLF